MKINLFKYVLGLTLFSFLLNSCEKEEMVITESETSNKQNILTFKTYDDFFKVLDEVSTMDEAKRKTWEASQGFESYGAICNDFYYSIDREKFKTEEEVIEFVEENSYYIDWYEESGEIYIHPNESDFSERFLMNGDKMFIIATRAYKKFEDGFVSTDIINLDVLKKAKNSKELSENRLVEANSPQKLPIYKSTNVEEHEVRSTIGNYRIKLYIQTENFWAFAPDRTLRETEFTISNYKKSIGIWWLTKMSTDYDIYLESWDDGTLQYHVCQGTGTNVSIDTYNQSTQIFICNGWTNQYYPIFSDIECSASNVYNCSVVL